MDDPSVDILRLLATMDENKSAARGRYDEITHSLRTAFEKELSEDPKLNAMLTESGQWQDSLHQAAKELFTPGVIVELATSNNNKFAVVSECDSGYIYYYTIKVPRTRSKHPDRHYYSKVARIVPAVHLLPKELQRVAAKMIAEVRLKEW